MDENDPRLIVTMVAVSPTAERAWNRRENRNRCEPAPLSDDEIVNIPSRETTPAVSRQDEAPASKIHLTFDKKPTNLEKGFVFGSDPQKCDVLLGGWGGFSRQHFRIAFNERGEVIFENTSRKKAQVDYNGENSPGRNQFIWILFRTYENIKITVGDLIFKVDWSKNKTCKAEYEAHRDAYLEEQRNALPPLSQLGVESEQTTTVLTAQHSPRQQPIYLLEEELGRGGFGTVHKAVDVSTGDVYAAKEVQVGNWKKEVEFFKSVSHVSVTIDPTINPCLTFRKGAYCGIRDFLGGAETSAGDGISSSWKLSLSRFHY